MQQQKNVRDVVKKNAFIMHYFEKSSIGFSKKSLGYLFGNQTPSTDVSQTRLQFPPSTASLVFSLICRNIVSNSMQLLNLSYFQ